MSDIANEEKIVNGLQGGISLDEMRTALDGLDMMVFVADLVAKKTLFMSAGCEKIYGASPKAFYDNPDLWLTFFPPEERASIEKEMQEWSQGKANSSVHRIIRADGIEKWIEAKILPVLDADGTLVRITGFATDITEKKLAAEVALKNATHYQSLFNNMFEGFASCEAIYDAGGAFVDFRYLEVNPTFEILTGLKDVTGKLVTEIIPGIRESNPEVFGIYGRVASTGKPEKFEAYFEQLNIWLSISVYSTTKGFFTAVFDNITERKNKELELVTLRGAVQQSLDIIFIMNVHEIITDVNDAFVETYGYQRDEVIGKVSGRALSGMPKSDLDPLVKEFYEKGKLHAQITGTTKDGKLIILDTAVTLISDNMGNSVAILVAQRDVSEREKQIRHIKELNDLRMKFIQIVSHQLRTPLGSIRWNLELMMDGSMGPLSDSQKDFVRVTHNADVEVLDRINDLLITMDAEEGRIAFLTEETSIDGLYRSIVAEKKFLCEAKQLSCEFQVPDVPLPSVLADPQKIRQIFIKLIDNAITYTPEKGHIKGMLLNTPNGIRFEISDNGIGIPSLEQKNIFKSFFRGTNAFLTKPDSTGVGLFIAKYFVEQHGGTIGFTSEEGKGSTFWFEIPIVRDNAATA